MRDDEIERLREALRLTQERIGDIASLQSPDSEPVLKGTSKRIANVLAGGRFHDDIQPR